MAGAWVIGEYGDSLLRGGQYEEEELVQEMKESDIVDLLSTILNSSYATQNVSEYIVTALIKLTTRLNEPAQIDRIRRILQSHTTNLDVEIQQRAVEYGNLFGYDQIRRGVLERMPPPEIREEQRVLGEATHKKKSVTKGTKKQGGGTKESEQDMLLDLMGGGDVHQSINHSHTMNGTKNNANLLADILGEGNSTSNSSFSNQPSSAQQPKRPNTTSSVLDLFDSAAPSTASPPSSQNILSTSSPTPALHQVYNKNNLLLLIQLQRNQEGTVQVITRFRNASIMERITGLNLQAAVPKTQRLQMQAISSTELEAGQEATQMMRVMGGKGVSTFVSLRQGSWVVRG